MVLAVDINMLITMEGSQFTTQIQSIYNALPSFEADKPLSEALRSQILQILNANAIDENPQILILLAKNGCIEMFKVLFAIGYKLDVVNINGFGLLHYAVEYRQLKMVKYLINDRGFKWDITSNEGVGLLHSSATAGDIELFEYLYGLGLKSDIIDKYGCGVLYYAVAKRQFEMVKHLINVRGFKWDITNNEGTGLLHSSASVGDVELFEYLYGLELKPDVIDKNGFGVLHYAVGSRQLKMVKHLINVRGFKWDITSKEGAGLLHTCASGGDVELFEYLYGLGLKLNALDKKSLGVLHYALESHRTEMIKHLINRGLSLDITIDGWGLLSIEIYWGRIENARYLISQGLKPTHDLLQYAKLGKNEAAIALCSNMESLNALYSSYINSFVLAVVADITLMHNDVISRVLVEYLPAAHSDEQKNLEQGVLFALKERKQWLKPLFEFCDRHATNSEVRQMLNNLLASKNLDVYALEKKLEVLLAKPSQSYTYSVIECRLNTAKVTGNIPKVSKNNGALLQHIISTKEQKNQELEQKNQRLQKQLEISYAFQFKVLCISAAISTVAFIFGILAICLFHPLAMGFAITAFSAVTLGTTLYGFYKQQNVITPSGAGLSGLASEPVAAK